jgi:hypothetical protein
MSTLNKSLSIGVYGNNWAQATVDFLKTINIYGGNVHQMEYTHREALFFDQDDIFIITDFGKPSDDSWESNNGLWLKRLNEMREIIYSRSMKSKIFANDDDVDVSKSLREACCSVVRVKTETSIPQTFAQAIQNNLARDRKFRDNQPSLLIPDLHVSAA